MSAGHSQEFDRERSPGTDSPDIRKRQQRGPRSKAGCNTCRARHVKCDERPGGCANCERLHLRCSNGSGSSEIREAARSTRNYRSCESCRLSKSKCSAERPRCARCSKRELPCVYDADAEPVWAREAHEARSVPSKNGPHVWDDSSPSPRQRPSETCLAWLNSSHLPSADRVLLLVEQYFINLHPLRCLAFIHKPSFLQNLSNDPVNDPSPGGPLLYIMCALGAQFFALDHQPNGNHISDSFVLTAGTQWAKQSQQLVCGDLDHITVERLMATVLLQEHSLRMGNFTNAFMLCGIASRMSQALQINLEYSTDLFGDGAGNCPSPTGREARRRLMWCCYTADTVSTPEIHVCSTRD